MASTLPQSSVNQLKSFVSLCKVKPDILNQPELSFFKEWLERYGGLLCQVATTQEGVFT